MSLTTALNFDLTKYKNVKRLPTLYFVLQGDLWCKLSKSCCLYVVARPTVQGDLLMINTFVW